MTDFDQRLTKIERLLKPQRGPTLAQIEAAAEQFDKKFTQLCERMADEIERLGVLEVAEDVIANGSPASLSALCEVLQLDPDDLRLDLFKAGQIAEWREHAKAVLSNRLAFLGLKSRAERPT